MNPETDATPTGDDQKLWTGLDEYMDSPAFRQAMADEFPENAAEWTDPVTRRRFMTLMGASLALAGAAGCSPRPAPMRKIVPYTRQPDQLTPGVPLFFASAFPLGGFVQGVLVRSHEGRPVKVEGNPDHPSSLGGCDVFAQASLLDLYDPDRSKVPTHRGTTVAVDDAIRAVRKALEQQRGKRGAGLRILTETVTSPALAAEITALLNDLPDARWAIYDPCGLDNVREGARRAFSKDKAPANVNVVYDFTKADVVVSLDADFLSVGPGHVRYCRDFATRRKVREHKEDGGTVDQMSRVYAVECMPSTTGSKADHRLPLRSGEVEAFARELAAALGVEGAPAGGGLPGAARDWIRPLAADLRRFTAKKEKKAGEPDITGRCVVVPGDHQPPAVHALCHAINSALGAIGVTVTLTAPVEVRPDGKVIDLPTLVKEMADKKVDTLMILGGNPALTAPADLDFAAAVKNVGFKLHLGTQVDETAALCDWHVNEAHYLEAWGDGRGHDGTAAIQQPLIAPLNGGKSAVEFVSAVRYDPLRNPNAPAPPSEGREIVRAYWRKWFTDTKKSGEFEKFWQESVALGFVAGSESARQDVTLAGTWAAGAAPPAPAGEYEINFRPDPTLFDGRFANNGWLQELAKPITMLCWDNAAFVSPATGKKLGLEKDWRWTAGERGRAEVNVIELEYRGRKLKVPAWVLPGHADGAVTIHFGAGRERAGRVSTSPSEPNAEGKPVRGFNAFALLTRGDGPSPRFTDGGLKVTRTRDTYFMACIQGNYSMVQRNPLTGHEMNRKPARRATVDEYKANPLFAKVTPAAPGEAQLIDKNVPGPRPHSHNGHDHGHNHDDRTHDEHAGHDRRLLELTMYYPNDALYPGLKHERRWAMAIDLGACTGCNACVMACVGENNTPVVGKFEVTRAHEMHWIRVDRYYEGNPDDGANLQTHFQPVPCQQCEKAPCEVVCPVGATVHSADGLNDMVYNRCVGTRYCSNNCPYKVRRFNFLTFQDWATESLKLGRNPDVSVRSRGVMEKCTYCVQRIRYAEIVAEREGRPIRDGEVVTACQAACPSHAIAFGDLNDEHAVVSRWKTEPTNYGLLAELNTMPRTTYLASVRNPNPDMPKGA
jgi:molybdopterin-containing oxidoreductase family iron-sulfur binding subunit